VRAQGLMMRERRVIAGSLVYVGIGIGIALVDLRFPLIWSPPTPLGERILGMGCWVVAWPLLLIGLAVFWIAALVQDSL
jgi:hypothetical protein